MNSPFSALFIALQAHIKARCPGIRWIDQDYGQIDFYEARNIPVSWPCAIIDLDAATYEDMGELAQSVVLEVNVRLCFAPYSPSNNIAPRAVRHKALECLETEWALNQALHGWRPDMADTGDYDPDDYSAEEYAVAEDYDGCFGALTRISARTERREDNIRVRDLRYRLAFEDYSTRLALETATATLLL